jgi:hypothetical protein
MVMEGHEPLQDRALAYAQLAWDEITTDPAAFGVVKPWASIDEWIGWELEDLRANRFTAEEQEAIAAAMREIADLDALNAPFKSE